MVGHMWGDQDFDWDGLRAAERFICDYVEDNSICYLISKEKYGTIRYEHVVSRVTTLGEEEEVSAEKHGWEEVLKGALKAVEKWPHLRGEILEDLAANEWLVGPELHDEFWES